MTRKPTYEELEKRVTELEQATRERNQKAAELWNSSREALAWIEHSPACTKIVDLDLNLQYMSSAGVEGLQISDITEYYGKPYPLSFFPDSFKIPMTKNLEQARDTREVVTQEASVSDLDGNELWFLSTIVPVMDDGRVEYLMVVSIETTQQRKAEEDKARLQEQLRQSQKMESIGTLAGGIAHDFNNILGIIVGNTDLAMMNVPSGDAAHFNLEEIQKASLRAAEMVKQILSFSRKTDLKQMPIRTSCIFAESLKLIRSSIPTTIEIQQDLSVEADTIMGNATQMDQILMNLCTNAAHAMQDNGGILKVELKNIVLDEEDMSNHHDLSPGNWLLLRVSDTGRGMGQEIMDRIFDPYFTTKNIGEGTGMGLSMVHGIIKSHGGAIQVESTPGKGTTFEVYLPLVESDTLSETPPSESIPPGTERILLVDDEQALVNMGDAMLQSLGYEVTVKTNSSEALEAFKADPENFDLLLTDMSMPHMTGKDLAQEFLKIRPGFPIVLCTGFSEMISESSAKELGINAFLMKPLTLPKLANTLRQALDQKDKTTAIGQILLVEDHDPLRLTMRQMLEGAGHKVFEAADGMSAEKIFRKNPTDLIITDLVMPEKEGLQLIMDLRQDFPDVKVIAISGGGRMGYRGYLDVAKTLGAQQVIEKPFTQEDLLKTVQEVLMIQSEENCLSS